MWEKELFCRCVTCCVWKPLKRGDTLCGEQRVWPGNDQWPEQVTWHPAPPGTSCRSTSGHHHLHEPATATPLQPFRGEMRPSSRSDDTVSGAGEAMLIFTINAINQVHKLTCCHQQDCSKMSLGLYQSKNMNLCGKKWLNTSSCWCRLVEEILVSRYQVAVVVADK